jgi:hypothetical protein
MKKKRKDEGCKGMKWEKQREGIDELKTSSNNPPHIHVVYSTMKKFKL